MKPLVFMAAVGLLASATACGPLSGREKEMVGNYFIPAISDIEPIYELHSDGTSVMRAIQPEVITIWVEGHWHLKGDSLIFENDLDKVHVEGDKSLMGDVTPRASYYVDDYNGTTLTLRKEGIDYVYHRRGETQP